MSTNPPSAFHDQGHDAVLPPADRFTKKPTRDRDLLSKVRSNGRVLLDAYDSSVEAVGAKREITLAEEWFLDNFHVVDEQLRGVRDHLPRTCGHGLRARKFLRHVDDETRNKAAGLPYESPLILRRGGRWSIRIDLDPASSKDRSM